eukprot:TRINITY_DN20653_c0_g1_i1.p1 TRINITY_DN20653_c0_g1~~TRINITY_DN20653_c0_g1_i1.p1  ORF type:complete len:590 (+),score=115.03 TRINITY_DN20653_c0_g1_i1:85-1854(+)
MLQQAHQTGYLTGGPKSRQERLRDFYRSCSVVNDQSAQVEPVTTPRPVDEALQLKKQANDLYERRDFEKAVELYSAAIELSPSSVLLANRAAAYLMLGWWDQALRDTKAAVRIDGQNLRAHERRAKALFFLNRLDEASDSLQSLEDAATSPPGNKALGSSTATSLKRQIELVRHAETLQDVRAALAAVAVESKLHSPLSAELRRRLVKCLLQHTSASGPLTGNSIAAALSSSKRQTADVYMQAAAEEALHVTAGLLEDEPQDAELRYLRGCALLLLGRHEDAEAQLSRSLQEKAESVVHEEAGKLVEVLHHLEGVLEAGNDAYRSGNLETAAKLYTEGIDSDPESTNIRTLATMHYNRSSCFRKLGEFDKALDDVNLALSLRPQWAKALYRRGVLLLETGRAAEALTELKLVQRADPTLEDDLEDWLRRAHNFLSRPSSGPTHYQLLQVPMDASKEDLKRQYKRLCLLHHPDKTANEESRKRFEVLQESYRFLMDDVQRGAYDFGNWRNKPVRHHLKKTARGNRPLPDNGWPDDADASDPHDFADPLGMRHLEEDDKVESVWWGASGCPEWLRERRAEQRLKRYAGEVD